MSDIENDVDSPLSEENNNLNFIEDIENSYKTTFIVYNNLNCPNHQKYLIQKYMKF